MDQMQLKNKQGNWKSFNDWKFKDEEELHSIYIENFSKTMVLGTTVDDKVILELKDEDKNEQLWEKGVPNYEGYFSLKNKSGKFMTAISPSSLGIKGKFEMDTFVTKAGVCCGPCNLSKWEADI